MERIVIEVSPSVALAWRKMPVSERRQLSNEMNVRIAKRTMKESTREFTSFIDDLQKRMSERGLTQDQLDEILKDED